MGVKQEILDYVDNIKENQNRSLLIKINEEINKAPSIICGATMAVDAIKVLIKTNDKEMKKIENFKVDVEKIKDPEVPVDEEYAKP